MKIPVMRVTYERHHTVNGTFHRENGWVNEAGIRTLSNRGVTQGSEKPCDIKPAYVFPLGVQSKVEWAVQLLISLCATIPVLDHEHIASSQWSTELKNDVWEASSTICYTCRLDGFSFLDLLDISNLIRLRQRRLILTNPFIKLEPIAN